MKASNTQKTKQQSQNKIQKKLKVNNQDLIFGGVIVKPHALKGEVVVASNTSFPKERFASGAKIYLEEKDENEEIFFKELIVDSSRVHKNNYLISFKEYKTVEASLEIVRKNIFFLKNKVKLKHNQFFLKDIIGYDVYDSNQQSIGKVISFLDLKFYLSLEIKTIFLEKNKNANIPLLDEFVLEIEHKKKQIKLNITKEYFNKI